MTLWPWSNIFQNKVLPSTTHTQSFNGLFSRTPWVGRYQKDKPFWILLKQMMGRHWHQPDHMQVICTLFQTDNHASTSSLKFLRAWCPSCCPTNSVKALKPSTSLSLTLILPCGQRQTMSHIVDMCPLTKFEGGLNLLHEVDDDAVIWLEATATAALAKWMNLTQFPCFFHCSTRTWQLLSGLVRSQQVYHSERPILFTTH